MANSDKDIRIVTNRNKSALPNISFTGYNNDPIVLNVLDDNTISFEGSSGQLFSVSNAVTTGTIFSVNDISGIPSFRIDADGTVGIAEFSGNVGIGLQSPQSKLSVGGDINASIGFSYRINGTMVLNSSSLGTGVTLSSLTSVGTITSGSWQGSPIGVLYGGTGGSSASDARSFLGAATAGTNSDLTRLLGVQHLFVTIPTAAAIGITVKAATSQSASMMEFVNSSNALLSWITKDGTFAHGAYFTHSDGRIPGISVQRSNAAGIVARGFNSANFAAIEVQDNPGALVVGLYPSGLVYGGVLQAYSSTASTNTTTGALIVAGGAGIAATVNIGRDLRVFSSLASSSPFTGALVVSGGVGISNNLFVGGGVAFTASIASTSSSTGTLVVTGGVGIGGTLFSSSSFANSLSGVVLNNGSVSLTGTYTQSNSSTTAFSVKDGSNTTAFNIDTIGDVISLPVAVASTSTGSGSLVVAGGVGIGGTLNVNTANVVSDFNHTPNNITIGGASGWVASTASTFINPATFRYLNNKYIGIGGTYIYYSDDMLNWSSVMVPNLDPARSIADIIYAEGKYVFVQNYTANAGYSTNLTNWTNVAISYNNWFTLAYGNGTFVVTSGGSPYAVSSNGINWANNASATHGFNTDIKFLNGYFYSSSSGSLERSTDGITWQTCNTPAIPYGLAYGNGLYVGGVYNSGTIVYSYDGLNFLSYTGSSLVHKRPYFFNGVYYITTQNNSIIRYSTDGFNWSNSTGFPGNVDNMVYAQGKLYAASGSTVWVTNATPGRFEVNPLRTGTLDDVEIGRLSPNNANFIDVSVNNNLNVSSQYSSTSPLNGALTVAGGVGIGGSLYVSSATAISGVTINAGVITGSLTGLATTSTYSLQSGYATTSGFATSATSAAIATTSYNVNVNSASSNSSHFLIFSPNATGSGVALSSESALVYNPSTDILSVSGLAITSSLGSTSTFTGALTVSGGVGIGGTLNISGNATIGGTLNVSGSNSYFQNNLYVGNNTQGRLYFSQATLGSAGTTVIPSMAFIGATNSPITLSVLPDNSLSFDGSSGQLFSINNNLSTGWIFSINDISGLPIFRTNADLNVAMGEYGGNVGIGLSNAVFKLQVVGNAGISGTTLISNTTSSTNTTSGALVVSGGVGIGGSLFVSSPSSISSVTINAGVVTGNLTGTATTATYSNQSGYAITSGFATSSSSASIANTAYSVNANSASSNASHFLIFSPSASGSGVALSTESALVYNPSTDILSVSGLAVTSSLGSTSSSTGALIVTGGVGIGGTLFSSSSFANSLSGVVLNNGSVSLSGTFTQSNSSTTAFQVRDGSNNPAFVIDTIGDVISLPVAVASTSTGSGSLVVAGGVGIGGTLNVGSVNVINNINYYPATGATGGIAWSTISLPAGVSGITKMIYANNKFVGVGNTFAVYSNDGLNWSSVNFTGFSSSENFNNLAFGNGKYVALAGSAATVALYSTDAITWTRSFLPASRVVFRGLAYGNGYFVGIEQSNIPVRSTDGINWTSASGLAGYIRNVKFINGLFIAVLWLATNEDFTYTSTDGVDWTRLNIPLAISYGITYGNGKYLASSTGTTSPIVSTDLVNWTRLVKPAPYYDQLYDPSYHNGTFYIPNNFSQILYSNDLVNWSYVSAANNEVVYGADKLIIANGTSVLVSQSAQGKADISPFLNSSIENTRIGAKSPDSATFTHLSALNNVSFTSPLNSTSVNNGSLVVKGGVGIGQSVNIGGRLDVSNTINYTATNSGIANTWTRIAIPSPVSISGLTYGNGLYVGVGYSAATSTDGITWTARVLPHNLTGVGYGNGLYVGVLSGSALGATSTDGITWRSMALPGSTSWVKVAYGNGIYVANAESSSVAYSYNGFQWTFSSLSSGSNQSTPVEFGGGYFIIRGNASSSYWISTDGINWTRRTNFTTDNVATNTIAYGDGAWVLAGSSASLAYTRDLLTFTYSGHYGWSGQRNYIAYTNGTFAIVDANALQVTLIYKNLTSINFSYLPGPTAATTITAGEGKFVAGAGSTVYVTDIASHTFNIFPHNSGELNNVRIGAKFPSSAQFSHLNANNLVSFGSSAPSTSTTTGALVITGGVGIGGSLFVGNTLSVGSSTASTSTTTGALIVAGGVGIGGSLNVGSVIESGFLIAPTFTLAALGNTGALSPSTTYYYKLSALDYFGNESLPSSEVSIALNSSTYAVSIAPNIDQSIYAIKIYRTTTSNSYTNSLVDTYYPFRGASNASNIAYNYYDRGKSTSASSPVTVSTANRAVLGSSINSTMGKLNLAGQLLIQSKNASAPSANIGIQLGNYDIAAVKDGLLAYFSSITSATGGTLTAGTTYYYVATGVDSYGNETFPSKEFPFTADANGAAQLNLAGGDYGIIKYRFYRTTTPGNYTNCFIGELPNSIDINYPTQNVSPPTSSTANAYVLKSTPAENIPSYIDSLDLRAGYYGALRKLSDNAYNTVSGIVTSGIAGTLSQNTNYFYKVASYDRYGNTSSASSPYIINTGPATSVQITPMGVDWPVGVEGFLVYRSTSKDNFVNVPTFYAYPGTAITDTGNYEFISSAPTYNNFLLGNFGANYYGYANFYVRSLDIAAGGNQSSMNFLSSRSPQPTLSASTGGTLTPGDIYYYKVMAFGRGDDYSMASPAVRFVVGAGGAVRISVNSIGITAFRNYNIYRTSDLSNWNNSQIARYVSESDFIDIGYPGTAGSPVGHNGVKRGTTAQISDGAITALTARINSFTQDIAAPLGITISGTTGGILTTNTTYYYRIMAVGVGWVELGQASKQVIYTTSATQNAISLSWGQVPNATGYRVLRSTTNNAGAGQTYTFVHGLSFVDKGYATLQHPYDPYALYYPGSYGATISAGLHRYHLPFLNITNGENPALTVSMLPPTISSTSTGTGGTLSTDTNYYYIVEAYDYNGGSSLPSTEVVVNTGANNSVTLTWTEKNGAYYHKVYRSLNSDFTNKQINQTVYTNSFTDINYPTVNTSPRYSSTNGSMYRIGTLNLSGIYHGLFSRSIFQTTPTTQGTYGTDYAVKIPGRPANTIYGSLLELGDFQVSGFAGSTAGTYLGLSSATGFTGNYVDFQMNSIARFKIDYLGNTTIGSTTGSGSTSTGALIITGGVGIGQSLFTSTSYASSISGAIFSNGSATLPGTFTQNNSSTTAFQVRDGSNNPAFVIDTIGDIISLPVAVASTSTTTGSLVVTGGVGIGGSLYSGSILTAGRLQNQSFSGAAVGASDGRMSGATSSYQYQSYGNGIFVASAVDASNAVYSTDGVTWQNTTLPVNQAYPINFFGNGNFVLASSGSTTILYSSDGASWSQVSIGNTLTRSSGVFGNGKYIIVGSGSTYNYSTNLTTWISATLPLESDWKIAYGNGVFVALGKGTKNLIYSYDGLNWSLGVLNLGASGPWTAIKYGNGVFVASSFNAPSGNSTGTIYSYDGINWFQGGISNQDFYNVAYGNGVYLANNPNAYWRSTDGINWVQGGFSAGFVSYQSAYGLNKFNSIGRFIDGPTNTVTIEPKFTGEINNVRIGAITPASGDFTNLSSTGSANLVGTVNAYNLNIISKVNQTPVLGGFAGTTGWISSSLLAGSNNNYALAFGNGLFVQIRKTTNYTSYSPDGKQWVASSMPFSGDWLDIAWGNDKFVAIASAGATGAYSGNGISWTTMNMPSNTSGWYAVTYGDDKFVAVGNGATVAYSSDGISWTGSAIANTNWTGIAYGNGTFVAVSGNGSSGAYSYDGLNWNYSALGGVNNGIKFITYGNGYFIVTNYVSTTINYSRDGINWLSSTRSSGASIHTDLAYGNGIYSIFNYFETSYSYDAINWLNGNTIAATDWQAVAYGNNRFVATSINTGQVGSIDGPSNTLNLHPKFTGDIDNVRIGAKQPGAAEFTTLAAQQPVRFTANTNSTDSTSGALVVVGGVGIGGTVYQRGSFNSGTLTAPVLFTIGGLGLTGTLTPSTIYYYVVTAVDFDGRESLPSVQFSANTNTNTSILLGWNRTPGAKQYRVYRSTVSGNFVNSFIRTTKNDNFNYFLDYGFTATTGTPPTTTQAFTNKISFDTSYLNSTGNILHGVNIPSGRLSVNTKNDSPLTAVEIDGDAAFTRLPPGTGVAASTGGTLSAGTVYYYRHSFVDLRGNESLASDPVPFLATAGGAINVSWAIEQAQFQVGRIYRSTNIDVWTNTFIAETSANGFLDINYPQLNSSPITTSSSHSNAYISGLANGISSLTNLALSAGRTNIKRVNSVPTVIASTSTAAGTLTTNTTYYYKAVFLDHLGGVSRFGPEIAINSGLGTAINFSFGIGSNQGVYLYRSTIPNFTSGSRFFTTGNITDDGSIGNTTSINSNPLNGSSWNLGVSGNLLPFNLNISTPSNGFGLGVLADTPIISNILNGSIAGTLTTGTRYYYRVVAYDGFGQATSASQISSAVAPAIGSIYLAVGYGRLGFASFDVYRSTDPNIFSNTYIGNFRNNAFVDIGYATSTGSPREGANLAKDIYLRGVNDYSVHALSNVISAGFVVRSSVPVINTAYSVATSGLLSNNTDYYYKIRVHFWANNTYGEVSDPFKVNTGSNSAVYLNWSVIEGAQHYTLYRSTDPKNFTNATIINGIKDNFAYDFGHAVATETPAANYNGSNNVIADVFGTRLSSLRMMGDNQFLRSYFDAPKFSTYPSATTGGTLANNTVFFYTVVARGYTNFRSLSSSEIRVNTASNNAISLNWLNVNGATGYDVYRSTAINSWSNTLIASNVQSTSFIDINYPTTTGTPDRLNTYGIGYAQSLFENNYNVLARTIFGSVNNVDSAYQNFTVRINGNIFRNSSASTLQVGTGFTNGYTFNGSSEGTELAIASGAGFTGSLLDAHSNGSSRFRINFDGSTSIGSTTGSGSTSTGALVVSGGVGIGQSLFTSPSYASSISGAIFSNGSATLSGTFAQNNTSTTAFQVRDASSSTVLNIDTLNDIVSLPIAIASTNTSTGSLLVAGGVGISGQLSFSRASFGFTGITTNPTMSFIGATSSAPITLSVLTDNSLSWEGSSGQLFSIDNNLSSGEIFSVSDISGLPIISASSGQTVTINEFGGFTRVGNGSINSSSTSTGSLQVAGGVGISGNAFIGGTVSITNTTNSTSTTSGALIVSGGVGIGGSLYVASATAISGVTINSGVITGSLTGTATTATYANQSGYGITSGYATTSGFATTSQNINVVSASTSASHPVLFTPATGTASGAAVSTESTFVYNPSTDILSVSGLAITSGTASTSSTTGALIVTGGVGIGGSLHVGTSRNTLYTVTPIAGFAASIPSTASVEILNSNSLGYTRLNLTNNNGNYVSFSLNGSSVANPNRAAIESSANLLIAAETNILHISTSGEHIFDSGGYCLRIGGSGVSVLLTEPSTSSSTGALTVAGGAGIAKTSYFGQSVFIQGTTASGSTTTGALVVSGGAGIGGSLFTSSSNASSISGVILNNGAITNTGTITSTGVMSLSNSSATAFQVRDGSNNARLSVDTIGGVVSVSSSTASTNTLTGALVVGGGLGVSGDVFLASLPNSKLSVMNSFGDEGGEIFLNKPSTNTTITNGVTIDIYQNRLRFFEQGGSARGFYLDITAGGNSAGTNLVGGGSGTVTSLTAGTGISFSTGSTITTTGTIRARRPLVTSFCAGYTPAASGADSVVIRLPDSPSDGTTAITYKPQEFHIRVETASATTTTIQLEKYTGTGAFSGTAITSVSISGGSTYEAQTSVFAGAGIFLTSGDKLRINFTALSASHANFSVYLELEEV